MESSIDKDILEASVKDDPFDIEIQSALILKYLSANQLEEAAKSFSVAFDLYKRNPRSDVLGFKIFNAGIILWRATRFKSSGSLRLNVSEKRYNLLRDIKNIIHLIRSIDYFEDTQLTSILLAYIVECEGKYAESLSLLRDILDKSSLTVKVDKAYLTFKIAILLYHLGENSKSIESLRSLGRNAPFRSGIFNVHIKAMLVVNCELWFECEKGDIAKAYEELREACIIDKATFSLNRLESNNLEAFDRIEKVVLNEDLLESALVWEEFATEALDRCEYALADAFLALAMKKAPSKSSIVHWRTEVCLLLGNKVAAERCATRALELDPESPELHQLKKLASALAQRQDSQFASEATQSNSMKIKKKPTKASRPETERALNLVVYNVKHSPASEYNRTYPFTETDAFSQEYWAENAEVVCWVQDLLAPFSSADESRAVNHISCAFRILHEKFNVEVTSLFFVDVMGLRGRGAMIAAANKVREVMSIEISSASAQQAKKVWTVVTDQFPWCKRCEATFKDGSMQDYFPFDADIVFVDTSLLGTEGVVDEAAIVSLLASLTKRLAPRSYVIIVTYLLDLKSLVSQSLVGDHLICIYQQLKSSYNDSALWILQTIPAAIRVNEVQSRRENEGPENLSSSSSLRSSINSFLPPKSYK